MSVILKQEDESQWLINDLDTEGINALLRPYDENEMEAYTVSKLISPRKTNTNVPDVIKRYQYEGIEL